ncbi:MAG: hypothetical protein NT049_03610, partial [Planctomycetota bacterium]|nr:hypothetical protein [Planctomycetota bacterium]
MFSRNMMSLLGLLMAAMLGFALVTPAQAIEYSWVGDGVGNAWSVGANWSSVDPSPTPPPGALDTARFGDVAAANAAVDVDAATSVDTIILEGAATGYTIGS